MPEVSEPKDIGAVDVPEILPADTDVLFVQADVGGSPYGARSTVSGLLRLGTAYLSVNGNSTAQTLTAATNAKITAWDTAGGSYITADDADDSVTLPKVGQYFAIVTGIMTGDNAEVFDLAFYVDSVKAFSLPFVGAGATAVPFTLAARISPLADDDKLELHAECANGADITVTDAVLTVIRVL